MNQGSSKFNWFELLLSWFCILTLLFLGYIDRRYWHSFWSYVQAGPWHQCEIYDYQASNQKQRHIVKCLEGQVVLEWK